ncbi:MAG: sigma-70 family RNA polymerase sigma factor [Phycisphaerae bacterium]|nr:sigma-70 family RNA polymerase sigma factor [Phycisphaerae bacterium]
MSDSRFEELVNTHGRDVLNVALRVLRDADLAKDVYQEVFLAIWRRWDRYTGSTNWGAYLYRVTVRKALELARARRPVPASVEECDLPGVGANPDAGLRLDELQQRLTESLAKLPRQQAEVFILSRIEGLDHGAIAGILGCSRNSVRVSLHRAVKELARAMSDYRS